jgi:hypothetical protein
MCARWSEPNGHGFINFITDMGPRPTKYHSVDRYPNREGNYEPGNCRWATPKEQGRNRRNNRLITAFGETKCMADWLDIYPVKRATLIQRLESGMEPELALTLPPRKKKKD